MNCTKCNSALQRVAEVRKLGNGTRRRRIECMNCGYRWTEWDGPKPDASERAMPMVVRQRKRPALTDEEVRLTLTRPDLNNKDLARLLGCSAETVRQIRCGMLYKSVMPDLVRPKGPRWKPVSDGPMCDNCSHWLGNKCSFAFPDPVQEGLAFAADCHLYTSNQ
jgi:hypothetical protein